MEKWEKVRRQGASTYLEPQGDSRPVRAGNGIEVPVPSTLHAFRVPRDDLDVVFRIALTSDGIRPVGITLRSPEGRGVSTADWRLVNVQQIWRNAISHVVRRVSRVDGVATESDFLLPDAQLELLRAKGPVDETLRHVGDVYSFAEAFGLAPVKEVQQAFEGRGLAALPRTTATAWVRRAREAGYIRDGLADANSD